MDLNLNTCASTMKADSEAVKFLTVTQFAKKIGVHPQTVRKWDDDGVLKAHHKSPSGRRYYTEEQVAEYLNK